MTSTFAQSFELIKLFKENEYQKIYIGADKESQQPVIINIIDSLDDGPIWKSLENIYSGIFHHVIHLENLAEKIILVTKVNESTPFTSYLSSHPLTLRSKLDYAFQYAKGIMQYDLLPNRIKNILLDDSQLVIEKNGDLTFDELIILNKDGLEPSTDHYSVEKAIKVIEGIISLESMENLDPRETTLYSKVQRFLENLTKEEKALKNLKQLFEFFRKFYLYDVCLDNEGIKYYASSFSSNRKDPSLSTGTERQNKRKTSKKRTGKKILLTTLMGILLITSGVFAFYQWKNKDATSLKQSARNSLPIAFFEVEMGENKEYTFINQSQVKRPSTSIESYQWEVWKGDKLLQSLDTKNIRLFFKSSGTYQVSLQVKDNLDQWSERYAWEMEILDENSTAKQISNTSAQDFLNYDDQQVEKDANITRGGNPSLKISPRVTPSILTAHHREIDKHTQMMLWLRTDGREAFPLTVKGYSSGQIVFQKNISHSFQTPEAWEMITIPLSDKIKDKIEIIIGPSEQTLWIGSVIIDAFK